jgi:hypothetical protein
MWDGSDTVGLLSCIIGTVFLFVPMNGFMIWVVLGGGAVSLIMGIVAVSKGSKIGIGGIILGALVVVITIFMMGTMGGIL